MNLKETLKLDAINRTKERVIRNSKSRYRIAKLIAAQDEKDRQNRLRMHQADDMYGNAQGRIGAFIPS